MGAVVGEALGALAWQVSPVALPTVNLTTALWDAAAGRPMQPLTREFNQQLDGLLQQQLPSLGCYPWVSAIALALLWQDQPVRLRQVIETQIAQPVVQVEMLAIAGALIQSLQHRLNPAQFLPQLIAELSQFPGAPLPLDSLIQVQSLVQARGSLSTARAQLGALSPDYSQEVALALFCWLTTPEQFVLTVLRAAQLRISPLVSLLAGALAGSQTAVTHICHWQLATPLVQDCQQRAAQILAIWSGADCPLALPYLAIGVPGALRDDPS